MFIENPLKASFRNAKAKPWDYLITAEELQKLPNITSSNLAEPLKQQATKDAAEALI